jgi:hypothetical protein
LPNLVYLDLSENKLELFEGLFRNLDFPPSNKMDTINLANNKI